jgi:transcriptional regulator with XRE-family HTH domain
MSEDPILRLPLAFGKLLRRRRNEFRLTAEAFARAARLPDAITISRMETGEREPTLTELFRIADALHTQPAFLFADIIAEWRRDPTDLMPHMTRASDFVRLYRLGYHCSPGDFRELAQAYGGMDQATGAARTLSIARREKGLIPPDTVLIYARLGYVSFRADDEEQQP